MSQHVLSVLGSVGQPNWTVLVHCIHVQALLMLWVYCAYHATMLMLWSVVQNYDRKLDAEESLEDLRELGLEVKDTRTGQYLAPGTGGVPVQDSARGKNQGAAGYTNGFGNPATMGKPLAGQVAHV